MVKQILKIFIINHLETTTRKIYLFIIIQIVAIIVLIN